MPFVNFTLASRVTEDAMVRLKTAAADMMRRHAGKDERWLLVRVAGEQPLYFRGSRVHNGGVIEVKLVGTLEAESKREIVRELTSLLATETGAAADSLYVIFTEVKGEDWGWNNDLFA